MSDLFHHRNCEKKLPQAQKQRIDDDYAKCKSWIENASLTRTPKLAITPLSTPNIAVILDVMHHNIHSKQPHILVMLNTSEKMMRLSIFEDEAA